MKTLLLMRHGKSSWKDSSLPDYERPLKKRGKKDSAKMGKLLMEENILPKLILCSSAKRARQTAEILMEESHFSGKIKYLESFYMSEPETYVEKLRKLSDTASVMIIAHNPGLETFLQMLVDEIDSLPTAAIAQLELPINEWKELDGDTHANLINLWKPRELE
jgi:phosphohistidine phosphatase